MNNQTKAVHTPFKRHDPYGAISMPVYNTVAFRFDNAAEMADAFCNRIDAPDYSRVENPTVSYFEDMVRHITGATEVIAFNSGMAAISNALMALSSSGSNIVSSRHLFGNTFSLIVHSLNRFNVEARLCDLTKIEEVEKVVDDNTSCIFLEILTNPQLEVADLQALSAVARKQNIPLVADSTMIPFTEHSLNKLGVDIELVSTTKYISGGATSLGGLIIDYGRFPRFTHCVRHEMLFNFGAYMTAQTAYMQTIGLETLNARYRVQAQNALMLAEKLQTLSAICKVNYVGLPDNPFHQLASAQFGPTGGAMLTIDLRSQEACYRMLDRLKLIVRATNLFDNKTLAIHPASTIFGLFTDEQRREMDILDTTIRLSVGLEDVDDLFNDIQQALQ